MLQLILGRSGYGKTHAVYERLCDLAWADEQGLILLVPEQFSFESERTLLKRLGPRMAGGCRFSALPVWPSRFSARSGLAGRRMDEVTRALLMSRALETAADRLVLYRRAATEPGAVGTVLFIGFRAQAMRVTPLNSRDGGRNGGNSCAAKHRSWRLSWGHMKPRRRTSRRQ